MKFYLPGGQILNSPFKCQLAIYYMYSMYICTFLLLSNAGILDWISKVGERLMGHIMSRRAGESVSQLPVDIHMVSPYCRYSQRASILCSIDN